MMDKPLTTETEFILPLGYRDEDGVIHKNGVMRLATAADEILPLRDHRVQNNPSYLAIIVLARVVVQLGTLQVISTQTIEGMYSKDFNYLQALYNQINGLSEDTGSGSPQIGEGESQSQAGNVEALPLRTNFMQR